MWAYVATYQMPNDDPEALERRVRVAYPVKADKELGLGTTPTLRLQRALATPGSFRLWEKVLVWSHWLWFLFPHGTVAYLLLRRPEHFPRGAAQIYATFDIGLIGYWAIPTAPPWYAAANGLMADGRTPELRRMMVEYGEQFWRSGWAPLYGFLGGNPLAAMPSLHFATSVTAAHVLTDSGAAAAPLAWAYTATLGTALVYLGEHYVVDLAAGLALAEGVRRGTPAGAVAARGVGRALQVLESRARSSRAPVARRARDRRPRARRGGGPRPRDQPPQPARPRRVPGAGDRGAVLPAPPARRASRTPGGGSRTAARTGRSWRCCSRCGMFGGYVAMFRGVFIGAGSARIGWRASYQITMAGLAASRIFAAGGAGGLVLTAWALRRSGMGKRLVADKTLTFLILTYMPYMAALIVCGLGLRLGLFDGPAPFGLTVVPAIIAAILTAIGVSTVLVPTDLQRRLEGFASSHGRLGQVRPAAGQPARLGVGRHARRARRTCATPTPRWPARSCSGPARSACCGRPSARSATRRRSRCSPRPSSSGCSATCCRCRAASAASRAA